MVKRLRVDTEAESEIADAIRHYEHERRGLGAEFFETTTLARSFGPNGGEAWGPLGT